MKRPLTSDSAEGSSVLTVGITDLMTSLAVIFILLFTAYVTKVSETDSQAMVQAPVPERKIARETADDIKGQLRDHFERFHLSLEADPTDPHVVRIVVPEQLLNFEFGKGTLSSIAERFLAEAMPTYAGVLCGALRDKIDSLVIEGHTDDRGSDIHNLRLSQERSLNVMVKSLQVIEETVPWASRCFQEKTSASGRGRQDLVLDRMRFPDRDKSRRVVFKIRLRSGEPLPDLDRVTESKPLAPAVSRLF